MGVEEFSDMIQTPVQASGPDQSLSEPPSAEPYLSRGAGLLALGRGNMVLVLLFAAGLGCVYLLSLRSGPTEASAEQRKVEQQVDSAIMQLASSDLGKVGQRGVASALVRTFYYQAQHRQIPLGSLKGNPFVFAEAQPVLVEGTEPTGEQSSPPQQKIQQRNLAQALAAAKQLALQSVLMNSHGRMAMISNNLLTEGQEIQGWTIRKILPREVLLVWQDQQYVLTMPQ